MLSRVGPRGRLVALAIVVVLAVALVPLVASAVGSGPGPGATASAAGAGPAAAVASSPSSPGTSPGQSSFSLPTAPPPLQSPWRIAFEWHVPVLMYHVVAFPGQAGDALPGLVVAPDVFAAQLGAARAAGWHTITAATLARDMATGIQPPRRTFVISIDDGHEDGYSQAFPILQQDGFVATYYVPTERIGHPGYLTADQILAMAAAGMEIADHTIDHVPLATVPPSEAVTQIDGSATALAQLLGSRPITLAYPYGNHDLAVEAEVGAAGFLVAFTTVEGCSETIASRLDEPRTRVDPGTTAASLLSQLDRCAAMPAWG